MMATREEAVRLLEEAGVDTAAPDDDLLPLRRVELCRRLIGYCRGEGPPLLELRWGTPILDRERYTPEDVEEFVSSVERWEFGLADTAEDAGNVESFGDLVLHVEGRLRELWWPGRATGCASQAAFYEIRRAILASHGALTARLRPATRLRDCLPAREAWRIRVMLERHFGVWELPIGRRVFGVMEFGATWLALWFPFFLFWLIICGDPWVRPHPWLIWMGFIGPPVIIAALLDLVSLPAWEGVRTLGDLVRWTVRRNAAVIGCVTHGTGEAG